MHFMLLDASVFPSHGEALVPAKPPRRTLAFLHHPEIHCYQPKADPKHESSRASDTARATGMIGGMHAGRSLHPGIASFLLCWSLRGDSGSSCSCQPEAAELERRIQNHHHRLLSVGIQRTCFLHVALEPQR